MAFTWLGRMLRNRRADESLSVWNREGLTPVDGAAGGKIAGEGVLTVESPEFRDGEPMPKSSAGKGAGGNVSPALSWSRVPEGTEHLVFILEDIDVPISRPMIHTLSILEPATTSLAAGELAENSGVATHIRALGRAGYAGPRPIPGHGPHRYRFMLFAIGTDVDTKGSQKEALESMGGYVLARGMLVGTYEQ